MLRLRNQKGESHRKRGKKEGLDDGRQGLASWTAKPGRKGNPAIPHYIIGLTSGQWPLGMKIIGPGDEIPYPCGLVRQACRPTSQRAGRLFVVAARPRRSGPQSPARKHIRHNTTSYDIMRQSALAAQEVLVRRG
jgi:hypothetical protein